MWKPGWKEGGTNEFLYPDNRNEKPTTSDDNRECVWKKFILKWSCQDIVSRWKLKEELVLIQLVQQHLKTDIDIDDIDIDTLAMQYSLIPVIFHFRLVEQDSNTKKLQV